MKIAYWITLFLVFLTLSIQPKFSTTGNYLLIELNEKDGVERKKYEGKKDNEGNYECIIFFLTNIKFEFFVFQLSIIFHFFL